LSEESPSSIPVPRRAPGFTSELKPRLPFGGGAYRSSPAAAQSSTPLPRPAFFRGAEPSGAEPSREWSQLGGRARKLSTESWVDDGEPLTNEEEEAYFGAAPPAELTNLAVCSLAHSNPNPNPNPNPTLTPTSTSTLTLTLTRCAACAASSRS